MRSFKGLNPPRLKGGQKSQQHLKLVRAGMPEIPAGILSQDNTRRFKVKVQSIKWDESGKVMTITYGVINKVLVINTALFSNQAQAAQHGYTQRFGDLEAGDKTGASKYEEACKLKAQYEANGDWSMTGERDTTTEVIAALHKVQPKFSIEQLQKAVAHDPEQVKSWRADPRVKLELAKQRAVKAKANADAAPKTEISINLG